MTQVSGSLKLVTGNPAAVSQVWLRAPNGRVQGTEYVTESPDTVQVTGGAVSFDALPGAMVMTLVSHGAPMHTVKLLVPDKTTATLAECIEAAELATDGTRSALERLALEVQAELGQVPSLVSDALAQDATIIDAVKQVSIIREDTTVGTRLFIGGTMVYGDTGWRDITGLLINGWTATTVHIRRRNHDVVLRYTGLTGASASSPRMMQLPSGFFTGRSRIPFTGDAAMFTAQMTSTGGLDIVTSFSVPANSYLSETPWTVMGAWPTSLPGTPA